MSRLLPIFFFFFFNDTATTEIYTLSLHDALPIFDGESDASELSIKTPHGSFTVKLSDIPYGKASFALDHRAIDRKSTRLNSSHLVISYAVFCLKKKKKIRRSLPLSTQGAHSALIQ